MPKILFVEDDPFIAEIYKKKFETSGFDVTNVTTGKAVLREAKEGVFDLILLDLVIPEMNGMEVLKELRTNTEYNPDLKIVIFSNLSSPEEREQGLRLGANGFISKTEFSPSEVVDEVNRFLRQFSEQKKNLARNGEAESPVEAAPVSSSNENAKRILLIEDEAVFVEMFGKRLQDEGYAVESRRDGASGLEAALAGQYHLIISDVIMPQMGGQEIVSRLRTEDKTKGIPIFLLSASLDDMGMKALADAHLVERTFLKTKITPSELADAVNDFFAGRG